MGAYEELVRRHQQKALRLATLIAGATDAEDAVQESFVKAYVALKRFRSGWEFRPWILRIVANEAKNKRQASKRRVALELRLAADRPSGDEAPSPEAAILDRESARELLGALSRLPEKDRLVIGYRFLLDLSEAETAAALGVGVGTAKSRLSRALGRLRGALEAGSVAGRSE